MRLLNLQGRVRSKGVKFNHRLNKVFDNYFGVVQKNV